MRVMIRYLLSVSLFVVSTNGFAADYYVDATIASNCTNYSPSSRSCGAGSDTAYSDIASGISVLSAGDTLFLRAGSYGQIDMTASGTQGSPISVRGMPGELAIINSSLVAIMVINRTDIILADMTVDNVEGFGRIQDSRRIVIDNIDFSNAGASGTTGSLKFVRSTDSTVTASSFDNGSDLLLLQDDSDRNVLVGNSFGRASHSLISIRCGSENVIRDNDFNNPQQKIMEILDCEGISDAPVRLDDASRNLIEKNRFSGTAASGQANDFNAIQHGGQNSIVRHNIFSSNLGGGINYQSYAQESIYVHGNRLYNNTFYNNRCYAVSGQSGSGTQFFDNRVTNNILYANTSCNGGGSQTNISNSGQVILSGNSIVTSDPGFVDAAGGDLTLLESSSQIDAARFVAQAAGNGSGTALQVDDASWFYDGYGIASESGDLIQLEGGTATARILSINRSTNVLTLATSLSWSSGQRVHLAYSGSAPDVGANEFSGPVVRPNPPADLQSD